MSHTPVGPVDVLVALPAHNEEALIAGCLQSVISAIAAAQQVGTVRQARVAVAAHRCDDDTAARARSALAGIDSLVLVENAVLAVGTVRTRLIERASRTRFRADGDAWVFSTDADTVVPPDWIVGTLARARRQRADLVLGLADLADWPVDAAAREAYERIIEDGLTVGGHRPAYAANLAVRLAAFTQVGGFPGSPTARSTVSRRPAEPPG